MEKWDACAFPVNEDDLEGRVCYGGLDLSSTTDITAFVLVFPPTDEEINTSCSHTSGYRKRPLTYASDATTFLMTSGNGRDISRLRRATLSTTVIFEKFIERLGERFNIREIAFDRWGAVQMVQNLEGMGFTVVPFGQGFKDMSPPTKELMKLTLEQKIGPRRASGAALDDG